ncbi:MAG: S16 family serine protease [Nitrososphaera sp.]|jgi:uncharacterized protein
MVARKGCSMANTVTVLLSAVLVISVIANALLYQQAQSLAQLVTKTHADNDNLRKQIASSASANETVIKAANASAPSVTVTPPVKGAGITGQHQSITAVAVKTIPVTDGFFQSVQYQGTVMEIVVDIKDGGEGRVLVNTAVPTGVDFQSSAKTAVKVAQSITGTDLSNRDIIFSISSRGNAADLQSVDGGSAGGAMTVLLASELQNKSISRDVLMTGTINPDGSIGQIGGVEQKAEAAGQYGAKIFLVPPGQSSYPAETCSQSQQGPIVYRTCQSELKPLSDITTAKYGMKVVEVSNIHEALSYFQK